MNKREMYLEHVAQTSGFPLLLEVDHARGMYVTDKAGKRYLDMNSGISVSSLGHCHPNVVKAIRGQSDRYMHTMVYGEHVQEPQVDFADILFKNIDPSFSSIYYLMSGTEATELAMKIGKRRTGRYEIAVCKNAYHGSTQGAESLRSDSAYKEAYLPLIPGIRFVEYNNVDDLMKLTSATAAFICEPVQAEAGVISPQNDFLKAARHRCDEIGALFVLDEIQTGFGRTGDLFAHQRFDVLPDVFLIGKAMGGGMPIAAVVASREIMGCLAHKPALGHITTFGGHPVSVAAAVACLKTILEEKMIPDVTSKESFILKRLRHPIIREVRSAGLMMAVELKSRKYLKHVVAEAFRKGVLIDYFLFNDRSFRLAPPLIAGNEHLDEACNVLLKAMDFARGQYR